MRLSHAHIQNFRCVRDLSLTWEGVTVLVGANSTGKSSMLHALRWFFEGGSLSLEDLWGHNPDNVVSVALTFADFNEEDREALGSYVTKDEATFWRTWSAEGGEKLTGRALAFPSFEEVRRHGKAGEKRSAYKALREGRPELGLSSARSADEAEEQMRAWEGEHPEELELAEVSATHLFGVAGQGKLRGRFDFVLVPAVSDPEAETRDARGTLLRQLVERVGGEPERMRERLHELEQDVEQRMTRIIQEEGEEAMEALSRRVSGELERLVPGGSVMLEARPPAVQMPAVGFGMRVADSGLQTEVGRQGHGFQRALLIALVQQLPATSEGTQAPSLFLAMEEPELYQHPLQARHFGQMLNELADSSVGGVQVAYATHSEHFVDPERYPSLRRFRRLSSDEGFPEAEATAATLERVQTRLAGVIRPEEVLMRVRVTLRRRLAEAVFARAVVLVEGYTDAGFLQGLADRQGGFDAAGVSVVAGMGKRQLLLPWAILRELKVPTYLIFDGDADLEDRMLAEGKERSAAAQALAQHKRDNELVLGVLGEEPEELPETRVTERYAVLETSLEGEFSAWESFAERLAACKQELGDWREKSEDAYRQAAVETAEQPPDTFAQILRSVLALAQ